MPRFERLNLIFNFDFQFAPEVGPTISLPNIIREGCQEDVYDMVNKITRSFSLVVLFLLTML